MSAPGCGKTPTACMFAYYRWATSQAKTVWAMPQSLMRNNRTKMLMFTGFAPEDVVILDSDHAPMTQSWTGPKKAYQRRVKSLRVRILDARGSGLKKNKNTHMKALEPLVVIEERQAQGPFTIDGRFPFVHMVGEHVFNIEDLPQEGTILVTPLMGPDGKQQVEKGYTEPVIVKDLIAAETQAKVFICTFAFLRMHWEHLLDTHPYIDNFMDDEHHLGFKGPNSAATEAFFHTARRCSTLYMMTGSLIDGDWSSAFPAIHAIEPLYYGSYEGFIAEHGGFTDTYGRVLVWKDEIKIKSILNRHGVKRTFEEVYGKEMLLPLHELVEVSPKVREEYDRFHEQAMLELDDGRVLDGTLPGVNVIRARQILAHPETMGLAGGEALGKDERLKIYAAEGQPMLVFTSLKPEQRRCVTVLEEAGLRVDLINSDVSKKDRDRVDLAFRDGHLDAIVASGPTAGVGYDWERANHVIFVTPDYQDVNFLQSYRRANRGTRTTPLRITTLEYEDTIEARMYQIISEKSVLANRVDETRPVLSFTG